MESSVVAPPRCCRHFDERSYKQWRDVLLGIEEEGIPFVSAAADRRRSCSSRLAGGAAFAAAGRHRLRPGTAHRALQKFTPHQLRCFR